MLEERILVSDRASEVVKVVAEEACFISRPMLVKIESGAQGLKQRRRDRT